MSNLISNVLDLMRLESGRIELRCDTHSVEDLVGTALDRLDARLQRHPVEIDLPDDLPPVHVDPMLVTQVLANLLDNAAKYTPAGTRASGSRPLPTAAMVRVVVEDEGPGLPRRAIRACCSTSSSAGATRAPSLARASGWRSAAPS